MIEAIFIRTQGEGYRLAMAIWEDAFSIEIAQVLLQSTNHPWAIFSKAQNAFSQFSLFLY